MKRRDLLRGGSLVLCLGATDLVFGASIVAVRVWPAADYTRVTIESDQPLAAHNFLAENPNRLVVDIDNLELSPALRDLVGKVRADDPFIAGVRVGQNQPRVVRLVLDLKQAVAPQQFTLAPVAAYQHRLVFDLYPVKQQDPVLALLRGKEQSEQRAAQEVQDALGEFIGKIPAGASAPSLAGTDIATIPTPLPASAPRVAEVNPATHGGTGIDTSSMEMQAPFASRPLTPEEKRKVDRLLVIAIDPGHGGEDPGAIGPTGLKEKDVVLAIAMQLRERLNAKPGVRVLMTRDSDFFVPLGERVKKAERVQADLFVSIHADAFFTPDARGASVFALSQGGASSAAARWMANRENQSDSVGGVSVKVKDAQVMRALLDMSTTAQIKDSLRVGGEVLSRIGKVGKLHRGEVEQASFAVLKAPAIPSILVETAFISNPQEEDKLRDADYRTKLVEALFTGIDRYFAKNPPIARHRDL
ncbi:N-acetylmuramoyl-L-alanine amidase [Scleromatobacter humisilvae]|uniref:N-acetylmuramoyl-L-alanine amidase AmiC n=1 Tax=Scleromatobacter humisilvae TaxID=2897159 RepID=A0A9X1YSL7_9BURK|nr:N-acetylmuramoyl-L-alanine amidase [Scleromatobacter humisilvae]MCK9688521.1 N-acetylmuramoyl-L-alanine amidase [Scleromatobacter humisilvae]